MIRVKVTEAHIEKADRRVPPVAAALQELGFHDGKVSVSSSLNGGLYSWYSYYRKADDPYVFVFKLPGIALEHVVRYWLGYSVSPIEFNIPDNHEKSYLYG